MSDDFVLIPSQSQAPVAPRMQQPIRRQNSFLGRHSNLVYPTLVHAEVEVQKGPAGGAHIGQLLHPNVVPKHSTTYDFSLEENVIAQVIVHKSQEEEEERVRQDRLKAEQEVIMAAVMADQESKRQSSLEAQEKALAESREQQQRETEALNNFKSFTGQTDTGRCRVILEYHKWAAEAAVSYFFDQCGGDMDKAMTDILDKSKSAGGGGGAAAGGGGGQFQEPRGKETRVEIHLPDGSVETQPFNSTDTLWAVYQFVAMHSPSWGQKQFTLMKTAPRQVFSEEMLNMTLEQAGLVPNGSVRAVLGNAV